ncbi:hypothetical protein ACFJGV_02845 [Cnuibacter sp. UC19_7]|uniref:hypothetical protein n=1 Tax=Cnuibacter sp. UC19_7 TaxID=3350166 RepID=UPI0036731347
MQRHSTTGEGSGFDSRFDAAFQPGYDDEVDLSVFDTVESAEPTTAAAARPVPLVDRFVVAIWIVGVVLVVAPLVAIVVIADQQRAATLDQSGFVVYSIVSSLTPFLLTLGVATLVGSLFLLAHRWERRR